MVSVPRLGGLGTLGFGGFGARWECLRWFGLNWEFGVEGKWVRDVGAWWLCGYVGDLGLGVWWVWDFRKRPHWVVTNIFFPRPKFLRRFLEKKSDRLKCNKKLLSKTKFSRKVFGEKSDGENATRMFFPSQNFLGKFCEKKVTGENATKIFFPEPQSAL